MEELYMKLWSVAIVVLFLLSTVTGNALGISHLHNSDFPNYANECSLITNLSYPGKTDTWFSTEPDASYVDGKAVSNSRFQNFATDYYLNDQTYAFINFGQTNINQKSSFT